MFAEAWVVRQGALGDFVAALPVLDALRARTRRLVVWAAPRYRALWDRTDAWVDPEGQEAARIFAGRADLSDVDLAVTYSAGAADALRACGVKRLVSAPPHPEGPVAIHDHVWAPLAPMLGPRLDSPKIKVDTARIDAMRARLRGVRPVVIAPGSGGARKRQPIAAWRAVAEALSPDPVLWVGGPLEEDESPWGAWQWNDLDLADLAALAACCRCWLGPDSGPGHVAAAVGARVGVWFNGTTDAAQWTPPGARAFDAAATFSDLVAWVRSAATTL